MVGIHIPISTTNTFVVKSAQALPNQPVLDQKPGHLDQGPMKTRASWVAKLHQGVERH